MEYKIVVITAHDLTFQDLLLWFKKLNSGVRLAPIVKARSNLSAPLTDAILEISRNPAITDWKEEDLSTVFRKSHHHELIAMTALLAVAQGNSFITENLFEDRFNHVRELNRMGANIIVNGRTATVIGVDKLYGTDIYASDLRAGAAMIVAALMAEGTARVRNIYYIDRGYEKLEYKLRALGADIKRIEEPDEE